MMPKHLFPFALGPLIGGLWPTVYVDVTCREHIRPPRNQACATCHGAAFPYLGDF
jgi:hypothetical protein